MTQYSSGCYIVDEEFNIVNINETAQSIYPKLKVGSKCYRCLMNEDSPCSLCPITKGHKGPRLYKDPIRNIAETVDAVDIEIPGHGLCHAMIFSTVGSDADFAATLPTTADELKDLALVRALTMEYDNLLSVDLTDGSLSVYRMNGKTLTMTDRPDYEMDYVSSMSDYIDKYVIEKDQDMMRRRLSLEALQSSLKNQENMQVHYKVMLDGQMHYYVQKIVRLGSAENFEHAVIGIACEDAEVSAHHELKKAQKNLIAVETDSVTGLYTKEAFFIRGEELLHKYPELDFDFCIMKIHNYDLIEHQYSQIVIDRLLSLIGRLLLTYDEETSCIAYIGAGSYVSLTKNTSKNIREGNIRTFHNNILRKSEIKGLSLKWSLYTKIQRDISVAEIYARTSYALLTIRGKQHDDYIEFDQGILNRMTWEEGVEKKFEEYLGNGEFIAWYQPKYSVLTGRIVGAEALVRWMRPDGTMVFPDKFIPVLEQCGKIYMLDMHIFNIVCHMLKRIKSMGLPMIPISVNLSRASIFTEDVPLRYQTIAVINKVEPRMIPIEITESAAVTDAAIKSFADNLTEKGFLLHMDDFGSGYSSMASLQRIPFECIKIDKSLVDYIGTPNGDTLLKHAISLVKECGMYVVAEGVEDESQYQFLKEAGCDYIQGYYFSKPLNESDFLRELSKSSPYYIIGNSSNHVS